MVAATLASCLPDEDGDSREVAAEMVLEATEDLLKASEGGDLSEGVREVIEGHPHCVIRRLTASASHTATHTALHTALHSTLT